MKKLTEIRQTSNLYVKRQRIDELEKIMKQLDDKMKINPINPDSLRKEGFDIRSIQEEIRNIKQEIKNTNFRQDNNYGLHQNVF